MKVGRICAAALVAVVGIGVSMGHPAYATTWTFNFTDTAQTFVAPISGVYDITAYGAQGGSSVFAAGGLGAELGGDVTLTAGEILTILVGAQGGGGGGRGGGGSGGGGGGGGATYVVLGPDIPLVVAGAGGGAGYYPGGEGGGYTDLPPGSRGSGSETGAAGGGGFGFFGYTGDGGYFIPGTGGGGYNGGIAAGGGVPWGSSYEAMGPGGDGGAGGGSGSPIACVCGPFGGPSGGGGGGYGGGSGGGIYNNDGGGGGSSYLDASVTEMVSIEGGNFGNGYVTIESMSALVPEPSTWAMILLGFAGVSTLAVAKGRRTLTVS